MYTIRHYSHMAVLIAACISFAGTSASAFDDPTSVAKEQVLLALLRSDAAAADKALACKKLAIHGSAAAVPDLAKLLPDAQLSSWARIALEVIPGPEADQAFRSAVEVLDGHLLVGTINSIGVRRDAKAVDSLIAKLQHSDAAVASAAAVALGRIGNAAATTSLRTALATAPANVRSAVAEGCVLCAEHLHAEGSMTAATELYDEVRKSDVPMQRIIEATRGAILTRNQGGIPLLMETFQSPDKKLFQLALGTVREFPGGEVDATLAAEMLRANPERAALIVQAMADRPTTVKLSTVLNATEKGDKLVRLSAIDALRRVGDDSCLAALLKIAIENDPELAQAAKDTLAGLPGQRVDEKIVARLPTAEGATYPLLLQLIGQRRIDAVEEVLNALDHADPEVRTAALTALGEIVSLKRLSVLTAQVVTPKHKEDLPVAQQALKAASIRMPDREACAAELSAALDLAPVAAKSTLLEILSDVGGATALQSLATAAKSNDPELQDTSSRLLGKWNGVDAAPVLLDLAKTAPSVKYQVRALRGYIGLARKFAMPEAERAEMCRNAINATRRSDEHMLVLDVLKLHPSVDGLKLVISAMERPDLKDGATEAALVIAQKVSGKGDDISALMAGIGLGKVKLEIIKAEYGAGAHQKDVTAVLKKQAGDSPLITLTPAGYNESFGGDPAPGTVKRLKIQYRLNDKTGEAAFAENALIILAVPK